MSQYDATVFEGIRTSYNGCARRLRGKHNNEPDDQTLPVRWAYDHLFPRYLVVLVNFVLLLDLLELAVGEDIVGVGLVSVKLLHDLQCFIRTSSGDHYRDCQHNG